MYVIKGRWNLPSIIRRIVLDDSPKCGLPSHYKQTTTPQSETHKDEYYTAEDIKPGAFKKQVCHKRCVEK